MCIWFNRNSILIIRLDSSTLVPIIIRVIIADAGYTQAYPDASEPLNQILFNAGLTIAVVILLILLTIAFVLICIYPLDWQEMKDIQKKIAARRVKGSDNLVA